jgi:hypothetical protein
MRNRRNKNPLAMSLQFVADFELRVSHNKKQRIARLKMNGRPTWQAETVLKRYQGSLTQLQNHAAAIQDLSSVLSEGGIG